MGDESGDLRSRLIQIGLEDPFVRAAVGLVALSLVASSAISVLGDGIKAVLTIGLTLIFGVIIVILRILINESDSRFVKILCGLIAGSVAIGFVAFIVLAVPAVAFCWPQAYHDVLGLKACSAVAADPPGERAGFTPVAFPGPGLAVDPANAGLTVLVFYRPSRREDAEHVVGAFLSAGFKSQGVESSLDEVLTDDRSPDSTLIKISPAIKDQRADLLRIVGLAIPFRAARVRAEMHGAALARGDAQVDLF